MYRGYVKLWRKSVDSGLIQNHQLWVFWTWCLLKASHKPIRKMVGMQMVDLKPGLFVFGRKTASAELDISERTIRTCIKKLKNLKNLTIKTTNKFSIVSITNWDIYQQDENESDQQSDQHVTSKRPASDHKQECKNVNIKELNNNNTTCPEPEKSGSSLPQENELKEIPFLEIPLIKKDGIFVISETHVSEWVESFPGIDVRQELRNLQQWNKASPERRKTKAGILKHIVSWLSKAQDRGKPAGRINGTRVNRSEQNKIACQNFIQGAPDAR